MFRRTRAGFIIERGTKQAVTHESLLKIPYEPSIEAWVRQYFPRAKYERIDCDGIQELSLAKGGVIAIQAPKGTGKSKQVRSAIAALPERQTAVQITFRRTLAWSSSDLLGKTASLYSSIPRGAISARRHPRLTIVVNSIARIRGTYDVVVIDELVSVLDMLAGSLLSGRNRVQAAHTLAHLISAAKTVIVADAMLDATCIDFVLLCRQLGSAQLSSFLTRNPDEELQVYDYVRRVHHYVYVPHAMVDTWYEALGAALAGGKRVVVPCMTRSMANRLADFYSDRYVTRCYTADADPTELHEHMADIHKHWKEAQLLIYSPVITAGCSFELKHFDSAFFYGYVGLGSVRSAIQMIARVRDLKDKTVHVYIARAPHYSPLPDTRGSALKIYCHNPGPPEEVHMALLRLLQDYRKREDAHATHAFPYYFWSLVVHSGAKIKFPGGELLDKVPPPMLSAACEAEAMESTVSAVASPEDDEEEPEVLSFDREAWGAHEWNMARTGFDRYPLDSPIGLGGTLLQKAHYAHPDHLEDLKFVEPLTTAKCKMFDLCCSEFEFPEWSTGEVEGRLRSWCLLIAHKGIRSESIKNAMPGDEALPTVPPSNREVVLYPPPALMVDKFKPASVRVACLENIRNYMNTSMTWLDASQDAWVLAGMEMALRSGSTATSIVLEELPGPSIVMAMQMNDRINALFSKLEFCWIGINIPVGRGPGGMGLIDYLCLDKDGNWHVIVCRTSGGVLNTGIADLIKTRLLAAAMLTRGVTRVSSVGVLYLISGQLMTLDISDWNPGKFYDTMVGKRLLLPWNPDLHALFVVFDEGNIFTFDAERNKEAKMTNEELMTSTKRLVTWGYAHVRVPDDPRDDRICDLEAAIASHLNVNLAETSLSMAQARVTDEVANADASAVRRLRYLYKGMSTKGLLVYFWNSRPCGLGMRVIPHYSFLSAGNTLKK